MNRHWFRDPRPKLQALSAKISVLSCSSPKCFDELNEVSQKGQFQSKLALPVWNQKVYLEPVAVFTGVNEPIDHRSIVAGLVHSVDPV